MARNLERLIRPWSNYSNTHVISTQKMSTRERLINQSYASRLLDVAVSRDLSSSSSSDLSHTVNTSLCCADVPWHCAVPSAAHAFQLCQQPQPPKLLQNLLEQILCRSPRLRRRGPHETTCLLRPLRWRRWLTRTRRWRRRMRASAQVRTRCRMGRRF